jgi:hypothetical protein
MVTEIPFLADWLPEGHAPLSPEGRTSAAGLIYEFVETHPIVGHLADDAKLAFAATVWRNFRRSYDNIRNPRRRQERTDIHRAFRAASAEGATPEDWRPR